MKQISLPLALLLVSSQVVAGERPAPEENSTEQQQACQQVGADQVDASGLIGRLLVMTGISLGICGAVFWISCGSRRSTISADGSLLRVLDSIRINSKNSLQLVQAGQFRLAVSVDRRGIESISLVSTTFDQMLQHEKS